MFQIYVGPSGAYKNNKLMSTFAPLLPDNSQQ